jgi:hypothetical protein
MTKYKLQVECIEDVCSVSPRAYRIDRAIEEHVYGDPVSSCSHIVSLLQPTSNCQRTYRRVAPIGAVTSNMFASDEDSGYAEEESPTKILVCAIHWRYMPHVSSSTTSFTASFKILAMHGGTVPADLACAPLQASNSLADRSLHVQTARHRLNRTNHSYSHRCRAKIASSYKRFASDLKFLQNTTTSWGVIK